MLLDDRPADWRAVLERRELMANGGGVRSKPAKRSFLFTPVRMAQRQPVTRRTRVDASLLDALHKRVSASEKHHRARGESVRGGEWTDVLLTGAVARDDFVRKRHWHLATERRRQPGKVCAFSWDKRTRGCPAWTFLAVGFDRTRQPERWE
jgi:hypothetical protein